MDVCKEYRNLIGACVDRTATADERARLEAHRAGCARCARALRELSRTRDLVTDLTPLKPSPRLMPVISARLREQRVGRAERVWWRVSSQPWLQPAAVAVILLLCIGLVGTAIYQAGPLQQSVRGVQVAHMYPVPSVAAGDNAAADDYVSYCVASHEAFEHDRAFGDPTGVQLAAYGP